MSNTKHNNSMKTTTALNLIFCDDLKLHMKVNRIWKKRRNKKKTLVFYHSGFIKKTMCSILQYNVQYYLRIEMFTDKG